MLLSKVQELVNLWCQAWSFVPPILQLLFQYKSQICHLSVSILAYYANCMRGHKTDNSLLKFCFTLHKWGNTKLTLQFHKYVWGMRLLYEVAFIHKRKFQSLKMVTFENYSQSGVDGENGVLALLCDGFLCFKISGWLSVCLTCFWLPSRLFWALCKTEMQRRRICFINTQLHVSIAIVKQEFPVADQISLQFVRTLLY